MRKEIMLTMICGIVATAAGAQTETSDSIRAQQLDEVVIEASNQRINAEVSTYIPMVRQKNAAQNAVSLLSQMSIPQISVGIFS